MQVIYLGKVAGPDHPHVRSSILRDPLWRVVPEMKSFDTEISILHWENTSYTPPNLRRPLTAQKAKARQEGLVTDTQASLLLLLSPLSIASPCLLEAGPGTSPRLASQDHAYTLATGQPWLIWHVVESQKASPTSLSLPTPHNAVMRASDRAGTCMSGLAAH